MDSSFPTAGDYAWSAAQGNENEIKRLKKELREYAHRLTMLEAEFRILQRRIYHGRSNAAQGKIPRSG